LKKKPLHQQGAKERGGGEGEGLLHRAPQVNRAHSSIDSADPHGVHVAASVDIPVHVHATGTVVAVLLPPRHGHGVVVGPRDQRVATHVDRMVA
jgi:hypothetical protein